MNKGLDRDFSGENEHQLDSFRHLSSESRPPDPDLQALHVSQIIYLRTLALYPMFNAFGANSTCK